LYGTPALIVLCPAPALFGTRMPFCACTRSHNAPRYGHTFAGGPGLIGPGNWPELCITFVSFPATMAGVPLRRNLGWCATRRDLGGGRRVSHFLLSANKSPIWGTRPGNLGAMISTSLSRPPLIPPPRTSGSAFRSFSIGIWPILGSRDYLMYTRTTSP
jgi:hypothetical protein